MLELRSIALGEFLEELEIGKHLARYLGISTDEESESALGEEKVGMARLGSKYMSENMGVTFFVFTGIIFAIALLVYGIYWCCKICQSRFPRFFEKIQKLKNKLFWNPIIRYTYLNAIKLNQSALISIVYGLRDNEMAELIGGVVLFFVFAALIPGIYIRLLVKNLDELNKAEVKEKYEALYLQVALDEQSSELEGKQNHHVYMQPVVFLLKRTFFMLVTIYLFNYPCLQMQVHILMTLAYLCYILYAPSPLFEDEHRNRVEVIAELLNMTAICILFQFTRGEEYNETQKQAI